MPTPTTNMFLGMHADGNVSIDGNGSIRYTGCAGDLHFTAGGYPVQPRNLADSVAGFAEDVSEMSSRITERFAVHRSDLDALNTRLTLAESLNNTLFDRLAQVDARIAALETQLALIGDGG